MHLIWTPVTLILNHRAYITHKKYTQWFENIQDVLVFTTFRNAFITVLQYSEILPKILQSCRQSI